MPYSGIGYVHGFIGMGPWIVRNVIEPPTPAEMSHLAEMQNVAARFAKIEKDPLEIIYKRTNMLIGRISVAGYQREPASLKYGELFYILKSCGIIFLLVTAALALIGMMLTTKVKIIEEKKQAIQNKIYLMFLLCSSVTLFGIMKQFFDSLLY